MPASITSPKNRRNFCLISGEILIVNRKPKKFLDVWKHLYDVYAAYRAQLLKEELAFEGIHREVAENFTRSNLCEPAAKFCGFNTLTKAEVIIAHAVEGGASVYWDVDEYYLNNGVQEAGEFFREYQKHKVLGKTFEAQVPANFRKEKSIKLYGAAQPVGQAKLMGQELKRNIEAGALPEETLIVLPDEKLLLPALHSVSDSVEKLNVTMGFSLSATPIFNFVELLIELQISRRDEYFHHRPVLSLLNHPFTVSADSKAAQGKRKEMLKHNWVSVPKNFLASETDLHRVMFVVADVSNITQYLKTCLTLLGGLDSLYAFDKEYIFQMLKSLNRMEEVLGNQYSSAFVSAFFRQYVRCMRIPFNCEPLGLAYGTCSSS